MSAAAPAGLLKAFIIRHWPELRLRTLLFGALLLAAALPMLGALLVLRPPPVLLDALWEERHGLALAAVIVLALLMLLAATLARTIVGPVERLSEASRILASGQGKIPDNPSLKVTEIEQLYADFRTMETAIARRSRYLRDFAASVSHEFKTPLAGISGAIELIEDHGGEMTDAERRTFLGNMQADSERLSRLVKRMMDLAKADMQPGDDTAIADPLHAVYEIAKQYERDGFSFTYNLPRDGMRMRIGQDAVEAIITTLIENAQQAGATSLHIAVSNRGLTFTDNGPGIAPADRERIFEPFFTSKRADGGTGLGLAIARSLAEAYGGRLELEESDSSGTRFKLSPRNG